MIPVFLEADYENKSKSENKSQHAKVGGIPKATAKKILNSAVMV